MLSQIFRGIVLVFLIQSVSYAGVGLPLSTEEKLVDFDFATEQFKKYYAPLRYKERRLGLDYNKVFADLRSEVEQSRTDQEFYQILGKLVNSFDDGHVGIQIPGMDRYSLPFLLDHFDGRYIVVYVDKSFSNPTNISVGDELLEIDGQAPDQVSEQLMSFRSMGYERADKRLGANSITRRSFVIPKKRKALLKIKRHSDDVEYSVSLFWEQRRFKPVNTRKYDETAGFVDIRSTSFYAGFLEFGAKKPFFYTDRVKSKFNFISAGLSQEDWQSMGRQGQPHDVFAAFYRYSGKNILLLRVPSYDLSYQEISKALDTYSAILNKYRSLADVLVLDQTHNPGGSIFYVQELARLFMQEPGPGFAFAPRADRNWLRDYASYSQHPSVSDYSRFFYEMIYLEIDDAHKAGEFLAPPIPLARQTLTLTENSAGWNKPVLLLIDELCGSSGDGLPMLMKGNKAATLFGHRTAGMGGNVESMGSLPNSGASLSLTRSLFYLATSDGPVQDSAIIENNGVQPDIQRDYGIDDFQNGYVDYVEDFSKAAVELL